MRIYVRSKVSPVVHSSSPVQRLQTPNVNGVHEQRELRLEILYEWVYEQRELRHSLRVYMNGCMNKGSDMYKYILTNTIPLIDTPQHRSHMKHTVTLLTPFIDIP